MLNQQTLNKIFGLWSRLPFSQLVSIDQTQGKLRIEFILRIDARESAKLLQELTRITVNKHPAGSLSWVGFGTQERMNSQYKRYRIDFIDKIIDEKIDPEKLGLYAKELEEAIRGFVYTK